MGAAFCGRALGAALRLLQAASKKASAIAYVRRLAVGLVISTFSVGGKLSKSVAAGLLHIGYTLFGRPGEECIRDGANYPLVGTERSEPLRAHLFAAFECMHPRLTTIVAPAGWGKTTVARLLAQRWERVAYCDAYGALDAADLASRLLAELARIAPPGVAGRLMQGLEAGTAHRVESARGAWREDEERDSVTIFDNLEQVADVQGALPFLDSLLDRPHPRRSVILCSRVTPRLRTSRFAPPHESWSIGERELALGRADLDRIFGGGIVASDMERVERMTQGWAIGVFYLERAARSGTLARAIADLESSEAAALQTYLLDEVIERLSERQRSALVACSAIGDCSASDAAKLLDMGLEDANELLGSLPFVRRAGDTVHFEVHPLLRTLALQRLHVDAGAFLERSARTLLAAGDRIRAAELFVRCGCMREAASAVADQAGYLIAAPSPRTAALLGRLEERVLLEFPNLWSAAIFSRTYSVGIPVRLREGRRIWAELDKGADIATRAGVLATYADSCSVSGLLDEAEAALNEFESTLRESEREVGEPMLALWRSVLAVWRSEPVDLPDAIKRMGALLQVDATDALYQHSVTAQYYRERGDARAEAAAHAQAVDSATRCGLPLVQVLVFCELAFFHWFYGDDPGYASAVARLEDAAVPSVYEGVRFFLACARGVPNEPLGLENHKERVAACLIGAGSAPSAAESRRLAHLAVEVADALKYPLYRVLTRVAQASLEQGKRRDTLAREAAEIARGLQPALREAVAAFAAGREELGMLAAFVGRYRRRESIAELNLFAMQVAVDGARLSLARRALEVLAALGLYRSGLSRDRLASWIWPEMPTAAGHASLRVTVNRLRKALGTGAVLSTPGGYTLAPAVRVDLDDAERAITAVRLRGTIDGAQAAVLESAANADLDDVASRTAGWEWFAPSLPRIEAIAREAALLLARQAMASEAWGKARLYASILIARDESDVVAQDLFAAATREARTGEAKRRA